MRKKYRIAIAQLECIEGNKQENLKKMEESICTAYEQHANLIVFPEMNLTGFAPKDKMLELAETREGDSFKKVQEMVSKHPIHVVYSFPEYAAEGIVYNTVCFMRKDGTPLEYYRKIHLFADERYSVNRGNEWVEVNVDGHKLGLLTCFDIEFPEASRALALRGVELLIVPSANMTPYEELHRTFIISRALENHFFVAYSNRIGPGSKYQYKGESAVVDPMGNVLVEFNEQKEGVKVVEIDFGEIVKSKETYNYLQERRSELYY